MTPIAFNLTTRLKACLPSGRDYSTILALYEALQEAAVFEMVAAEPEFGPVKIGSKVRIVRIKDAGQGSARERLIGQTFTVTNRDSDWDGEPSWFGIGVENYFRWRSSELEVIG